MGFGAAISKIGQAASKALDTSGDNSDKKSSVSSLVDEIKSIFKKAPSGKNDPSATGAGDLGDMSTGLASAKKGGTVKKTGYIKLHKGEKVLTRKQAKKTGPRKRA